MAARISTVRGAALVAWQDQSGAAATEFVVLLPAMLAFVFGIFEFSRIYFIRNALQYGAEEAGRVWMGAASKATADGSPAPACSTALVLPSFAARIGSFSPIDPNSVSFSAAPATIVSAAVITATSCVITARYTVNFVSGLSNFVPGLPTSYTLIGQSVVPQPP